MAVRGHRQNGQRRSDGKGSTAALNGAGQLSSTVSVLPRIERRRSRVHGWGVYAAEAITKNTRIIDYAGEKIRSGESSRREERYLTKGCIWCFRINRAWARDANVGGNVARFINHACKPNCYSQIVGDIIWIRAGRNIRKGEELTYNYYTQGDAEIPCRCREGCKGML